MLILSLFSVFSVYGGISEQNNKITHLWQFENNLNDTIGGLTATASGIDYSTAYGINGSYGAYFGLGDYINYGSDHNVFGATSTHELSACSAVYKISGNPFIFDTYYNSNQFRFGNDGTWQLSSVWGTVDSGKTYQDDWTLICFSISDTDNEIKFYINGSLIYNISNSGDMSQGRNVYTNRFYSSGWYSTASGYVDEVIIWDDYIINNTAVAEIWNNGDILRYPFTGVYSVPFNIYTSYYDNLTLSTDFLQGDDIYTYLNNTDNLTCELHFNDTVSIENNLFLGNYSDCSSGCDNDSITFTVNKSFSEPLKGWNTHFLACQESSGSKLSITIDCGNDTLTQTLTPLQIPNCGVLGYDRYFLNFSVCETNSQVNITYDSNALTPSKAVILENLNIDQEYYSLTTDYVRNISNNKSYFPYEVEFYSSGIQTLKVTCNETIKYKSLSIGDIAPLISLIEIDSDCYNVSYSDNMTLEYCSSDINLSFDIQDITDINETNVSIICNSSKIYNQSFLGDFNFVQASFNGSLLRDFSDITDLNINCYVFVNSSDGIEQRNVYYNFIVNDTISPVCTGLNYELVTNQSYKFDIDCYDESFYSFNLSCSHGFNHFISGLNTQHYKMNNNTIINETTFCSYEYCDGHTNEKLQNIKALKPDNNTMIVNSYLGSTVFEYIGDDNIDIDFYKIKDRYKFTVTDNSITLKDNSKTKKLKNYKFKYSTTDGHYIPSTEYKAWIVDLPTKTWFDLNSDQIEAYTVKETNKGEFEIDIMSYDPYLEFESIGELNCVSGSYNITYLSIPEPSGFFTQVCPITSTANSILFGVILLITFGLLVLGLFYKMGLFTLISGVLFVFLSFSLYGCNTAIGAIFAFIGLMGLAIGFFAQRFI